MVYQGNEKQWSPEYDVCRRYDQEHFHPLHALALHPSQIIPHLPVLLDGAGPLKQRGVSWDDLIAFDSSSLSEFFSAFARTRKETRFARWNDGSSTTLYSNCARTTHRESLTFGVVPFLASTAPSSFASAFVAPWLRPPVTLTSVVTRPATRTWEAKCGIYGIEKRATRQVSFSAHRLDVGFRQVPVQLSQVEERERHANHVDDDPQHVEYVVAEGPVHQRATGRVVTALRVGR